MNLTFFPVEDVPTPWSVPERVASERNPSSRTAFGRTAPDKPGTCAKSQRVMPLANQAVRIVRRTQRKQRSVPGRNWGVLEVPACYVSMLERPPQ